VRADRAGTNDPSQVLSRRKPSVIKISPGEKEIARKGSARAWVGSAMFGQRDAGYVKKDVLMCNETMHKPVGAKRSRKGNASLNVAT